MVGDYITNGPVVDEFEDSVPISASRSGRLYLRDGKVTKDAMSMPQSGMSGVGFDISSPTVRPPLKLVDGDTLLIDNSSLEAFTQCARKGEYRIIHKRVEAEDKSALNFGAALHSALELRYRACGANEPTLETEARQLLLLERWWERQPTALGDYRTLGLAQQTIQKYNRKWTTEAFDVPLLEGQPVVEQPFAMPLGIIYNWDVNEPEHPAEIKVVWTGRIDLIIKEGDAYFVLDHKSTKMGGDYFMTEFAMSSPLMGYCWAMRERYKVNVQGGIINGLVVRAPVANPKAGTKKLDPFPRQKFFFDNERLDEWRDNTLQLVQQFLNANSAGIFPMHQKQCVTKYGKCEYWDVCTLSKDARLPYLYSDAYRTDDWSPLTDRPVAIEEVMNIPADQLVYPSTHKIESEPTIDISSLLE